MRGSIHDRYVFRKVCSSPLGIWFMDSMNFQSKHPKPGDVDCCMLPRFNVKNGQISHLHNLLFITGAESHPELSEMLQETGRPSELPTIFAPNRTGGDMSDHGIFRRNGNPYLFLSRGRWQHYHEPRIPRTDSITTRWR